MFRIVHHLISMADQLPTEGQQVFWALLELLHNNEDPTGGRKFTIRTPAQSTPTFSLCSEVQIFFDTMTQEIRKMPLQIHNILLHLTSNPFIR